MLPGVQLVLSTCMRGDVILVRWLSSRVSVCVKLDVPEEFSGRFAMHISFAAKQITLCRRAAGVLTIAAVTAAAVASAAGVGEQEYLNDLADRMESAQDWGQLGLNVASYAPGQTAARNPHWRQDVRPRAWATLQVGLKSTWRAFTSGLRRKSESRLEREPLAASSFRFLSTGTCGSKAA